MHATSSYADLNGTNHNLYKISLKGTTFSGHPTRTTLGNSLRTLLYVCFLLYKSGFKEDAVLAFFGKSDNIIIYVAGDDVIVSGRKDMVQAIYDNVYITHARDSEYGVHGLGQVAKEPMLNDADYFDFLSKDAYYDGSWKVVRKLDRVVNRHDASQNVFKVKRGYEKVFAA